MRKPRIEFPGAVYHVIARGNQRHKVFWDQGDYVRYLKLMGETFEAHGFDVYAYCLMANHVHILIYQRTTYPLSRAMHRLQSAYTVFFNHKHHQIGHLFQGRYKSIVVDKNAYLLELVRYIHLNPWRAKAEKRLGEYQWTSHHKYIGRISESLTPAKEKTVLSMFSGSLSAARNKYLQFIIDGMQQGHCNEFYDLRDGRILGGDAFEVFAYQNMDMQHKPKMRLRMSIKEIWLKLLTRESLKEEPKGWIRSKLIGETAYWAVERLCVHQKEVAAFFGVDPSTVNRSINRQKQRWLNDPYTKKQCEKWIKEQ